MGWDRGPLDPAPLQDPLHPVTHLPTQQRASLLARFLHQVTHESIWQICMVNMRFDYRPSGVSAYSTCFTPMTFVVLLMILLVLLYKL